MLDSVPIMCESWSFTDQPRQSVGSAHSSSATAAPRERIDSHVSASAGTTRSFSTLVTAFPSRRAVSRQTRSMSQEPVPDKIGVAVLDDYQQVATNYGPWSTLADRIDLHVIGEHLFDRHELARRLEPFAVVVAMRERTTLDAALLAEL